jgi:hypothetical protein
MRMTSDRRWLTEFSHHAKLKYIVVAYITYIQVGISAVELVLIMVDTKLDRIFQLQNIPNAGFASQLCVTLDTKLWAALKKNISKYSHR